MMTGRYPDNTASPASTRRSGCLQTPRSITHAGRFADLPVTRHMNGGQNSPTSVGFVELVRRIYAKLTPRPGKGPMRHSEATDLAELSTLPIDGTSVACQFLADSGIFTSRREPVVTTIGATWAPKS